MPYALWVPVGWTSTKKMENGDPPSSGLRPTFLIKNTHFQASGSGGRGPRPRAKYIRLVLCMLDRKTARHDFFGLSATRENYKGDTLRPSLRSLSLPRSLSPSLSVSRDVFKFKLSAIDSGSRLLDVLLGLCLCEGSQLR